MRSANISTEPLNPDPGLPFRTLLHLCLGPRDRRTPRIACFGVLLALSMLGARPAGAMLWLGEGHGVPMGYTPKDFTIIQRGTVFHAYYILSNPALRGGNNLQQHQNESRLGHSVSQNLYDWTFVDSSFAVEPNGWDCHHLWSPTIVQAGGKYWMFFTGVEDSLYNGVWLPARESIGAAWSTDLFHWQRMPGPVFDCGAPYYTWGNCGAGGLRDPFVMRSSGPSGSRFWMYATTQPSSVPSGTYDPYASVVGTAWADSTNLQNWSDLGPLWSTYRTYQGVTPGTNKVESPHLYYHGGQWYLFFTGQYGICYLTGPNPIGDVPLPAGSWTYHDRFTEVSASEFASETFTAHWASGVDEDYFATVESVGNYRHIIHFRSVNSTTSYPLLTDPVELQVIEPLSASVVSGDSIDVAFVSSYPTIGLTIGQSITRSAPLEVYEVDDYSGVRNYQKVPPADYGLPNFIRITTNFQAADYGETIRFHPKWHQDFDDTPDRDEIQLRVRGVAAPVFTINRYATGNVAADAPPVPSRLALRLIGRASEGAGVTMRLDLPEAGEAKLELFDLTGRRIRVLASGPMTQGEHLLTWDRRDDHGVTVETGVYFARVSTLHQQAAIPVSVRR